MKELKTLSCILVLVLVVFGMQIFAEDSFANNGNPVAVLKVPGNIYAVNPNEPITFDGSDSYDTDSTGSYSKSVSVYKLRMSSISKFWPKYSLKNSLPSSKKANRCSNRYYLYKFLE